MGGKGKKKQQRHEHGGGPGEGCEHGHGEGRRGANEGKRRVKRRGGNAYETAPKVKTAEVEA